MEQEYKKHTCIACGVLFCITKEYDQELLRNKRAFYCPNGHSQSYVGKTQEQLIQEEKEKANRYYNLYSEQRAKNKNLENTNKVLKGHLTRHKKKENGN